MIPRKTTKHLLQILSTTISANVRPSNPHHSPPRHVALPPSLHRRAERVDLPALPITKRHPVAVKSNLLDRSSGTGILGESSTRRIANRIKKEERKKKTKKKAKGGKRKRKTFAIGSVYLFHISLQVQHGRGRLEYPKQ